LAHGCLEDIHDDRYPTALFGWAGDALELATIGTHFGYVYSGPASLDCEPGTFTLSAGMYFAVPGRLTTAEGSGLVISRLGYRGFFHLGGPIENEGRLRYIDGCTDSLLIPPVIRGDPCLNLLHLPAHTRQTRHTHPSIRVGLIIRGSGLRETPEERIPLAPGQAFMIRAGGPHSFHMDESSLLVLAYHPDSDFGPTHENHPMINRTIIERSLEPAKA
jgi:hypothetical protein